MNGPQDTPGAADPQSWQPPQTSPRPPAPDGGSRAAAERPPISAYDPRYKSPLVASFLSLFPGVGQIYVGYYRLGFTHAIIVAGVVTLLASNMDDAFRPLLGIFLAFFWLYNIIDAGRRAALYNHALREGATFDLPSTPALSSGSGTLAGGVALIVIGGLFLMHTALDFSMEWVEDWWPVGPILFGVYLVYKSLESKNRTRDPGRAD